MVSAAPRGATARAPRAAYALARLAFALLALACNAAPRAGATATTRGLSTFDQGGVLSADAMRTGWYADEPLLDPTIVGSSSFGPLFDAPVDGQLYAQPLYVNGALLVATETNHVYALDAATGATKWTRQLGQPWNAVDLNCGDLFPTVGITGTPAIDPATQTAYLLAKTYASGSSGAALWSAHALDLVTGDERPGFPVTISGAAANDPTQQFDAAHQHQRPGLLFMNGVVYAAFGSHCDRAPYAGWVAEISEKGALTTLWMTEAGPARTTGGGVWMAGGGLVSDRDGDLLFATGNDSSGTTTPVPGHTPPGALGEAVVRLRVQADGSLKAVDFFSPAELPWLNQTDSDLGSGAPIALPSVFGTPSHPNLLVQAGKTGYLYLLDRDDLGGYQQGAGGTDRVLQRFGPAGGVWSRASVWPGDGGYLYMPVAFNCEGSTDPAGCLRAYAHGATAEGTPVLSLAATSTDSFAYGSSAAVITSDGTRSGSAMLWTIWSSGSVSATSQLRAYDAVPDGGSLKLRFLAGIGGGNRYTAPCVGNGRVYVGTGDGHVLGFGITGGPPLRATGTAFGPTIVGDTRTSNVELAASGPVTVVALAASGDFALTPDAPSAPFTMAAGDLRDVPVAFRPTLDGPVQGTLVVTTAQGTLTITLTGVGQSAVPRLSAAPAVLAFAPLTKGATATQTVSLTNVGAAPVTISAVAAPSAPFTADDLPSVGTEVPAGASIDVTVRFAPTSVGSASSSLAFTAGGTVSAVAIEGTALAGGQLRLAPTQLDFGYVNVGVAVRTTFWLTNVGDAPVVIEKSKPPTSPAFQPLTSLPEGTIIAPGASSEQIIRVSPDVVGPETDAWVINADDGVGVRQLSLSVTGYMPPTPPPAPAPPADAGMGTPASATSQASAEGELVQNQPEEPAVVGHACAIAGRAGAPGPAGLLAFGAGVAATLVRRRRRLRPKLRPKLRRRRATSTAS